jgi:hypothetical protein
MTILWSNNASTTVSGSINASATAVTLVNGAIFPQPTGANYYVATFYDQATKTNFEIVHVTAMAGNVATIVRAQEGTTAQNWTAGDIFANLVTAGTLNNFVQAGTGPADTSIVYVGDDVSTTANLIVANTNPVPPNYADGMQFNIKIGPNIGVNGKNTGAVTAQFNGLAAQPVYRTDGSNLPGNVLFSNQEAIFVYRNAGGVTGFQSTIMALKPQPPVTTFYVDAALGNDSNTGVAPGTGYAFRTIQGAINAISTNYISANTITLVCADGTYTSGCSYTGSYIAQWSIVGNTSNPGNCVINCTSTNGASYVSGSAPGRCIDVGEAALMSIQGFTLQSYLESAAASAGTLSIANCNFTAPTYGSIAPVCAYNGSNIVITGTCQYTSNLTIDSMIFSSLGSSIILGYNDPFSSSPVIINIQGTPTFINGTVQVTSAGVISVFPAVTSFTGVVPTGPRYRADFAGGIAMGTFQFPGTQPGVVVAPGWVA